MRTWTEEKTGNIIWQPEFFDTVRGLREEVEFTPKQAKDLATLLLEQAQGIDQKDIEQGAAL